MIKIRLKAYDSAYQNLGQRAEQVTAYTLTGIAKKADNVPHNKSGDIGRLQVKSARATICKGIDLMTYLDTDAATHWGYVTKDLTTIYIMDRREWTNFCTAFATITRDSKKNGGGLKLRLRSENKMMREWLESHSFISSI